MSSLFFRLLFVLFFSVAFASAEGEYGASPSSGENRDPNATTPVIGLPTSRGMGEGPPKHPEAPHIESNVSGIVGPAAPTVTSTVIPAPKPISPSSILPESRAHTESSEPPSVVAAHTEISVPSEKPAVPSYSPAGYPHTEIPASIPSKPHIESSALPTPHVESSVAPAPRVPSSYAAPQPTGHVKVPASQTQAPIAQSQVTPGSSGLAGVGGASNSQLGNTPASPLPPGMGNPPTNNNPGNSNPGNDPYENNAPPTPAIPAPITIGTQTLLATPMAIQTTLAGTPTTLPTVLLGSQTLLPGQTLTINNVPVALPTAPAQPAGAGAPASAPAALVVAGSSTIALPTGAPNRAAVATTAEPPPLYLFGTTATPTALPSASGAAYVIAGQTLTLGGSISLGPSGNPTVVALTTNAAGQTVVVAGAQSSMLVPVVVTRTLEGVQASAVGGTSSSAALRTAAVSGGVSRTTGTGAGTMTRRTTTTGAATGGGSAGVARASATHTAGAGRARGRAVGGWWEPGWMGVWSGRVFGVLGLAVLL